MADIRVANLADEDAVRRVLDLSYRTLLAESYGANAAAEIAEYARGQMSDLLRSGRYYVGCDMQGVVACGGWSDQTPSGAPLPQAAAFVRRFAVLPGHERQGLGRAIFEACRSAADAVGTATMYVRSTINAEPFYRSLGFVRIEPTDIELRDGRRVGAVLMKRAR